MEYKKIANFLSNTLDEPSKFRTKNLVEINDESKKSYSTGSDIKFKTTMQRSNLCDYVDAYILVKGTTTITGVGNNADGRQADERNKGVTFKSCDPFTKCISRINNTEIDNTQDIDIVLPMYNLIEIVIIIQKHQEIYSSRTKINPMIACQTLDHLNLKKK